MLLQVTTFGQPIGAIVADTQMIAQRAAKLVKIEYEDLPTVVTIQVRINNQAHHTFIHYPHECIH